MIVFNVAHRYEIIVQNEHTTVHGHTKLISLASVYVNRTIFSNIQCHIKKLNPLKWQNGER